ncbi:acyl-coenzyme A thioesterase 8 [Alligator sinensis]|uniref:Acyl-coenzyme A thioesterase 8 n=1 Tax=Alligator sinensis TaxID=38654 RepID=A0A3Q0FKF5_ALLSI|nr:acyl-coenzyme A thioesterase 8 [Alligator sinensis]
MPCLHPGMTLGSPAPPGMPRLYPGMTLRSSAPTLGCPLEAPAHPPWDGGLRRACPRRGRHYWVPVTRRLFGGQIVGQALVAAARAVGEDMHVHSLHCYFVRAGDPGVPVLYQVERTRTGRSFSVRSVKAVQHGKPILICQASFQRAQPSPVQHQFAMPAVPAPEELLTQDELIHKYLQTDFSLRGRRESLWSQQRTTPLPRGLGFSAALSRDPNLVEKYRQGLNKMLAQNVPIEIKPVNPPDVFHWQPQEPKQLFWVRARGYIGEGDMKLHCCVAAYISDYAFLGTALLPHRQHTVEFMVSLDHSMWFHAPFRADHWMLYECESPWAGGSRGLVHGRLWRRDGVLAVTCAQEGVIRVAETPIESKL